MGTKDGEQATNDPTNLGRCTDCGEVSTVITSSSGEFFHTGTDGSCPDCGNDSFTVIRG